jgi:hypothetical protein
METSTRQVSEEPERRETELMNPADDGGAGRDMRFAFGGLGLCILAALIVTLVS